jgi:hypothetical protein
MTLNENQEILKIVRELQKQLVNSNQLLDDLSLELNEIKEKVTNPPSTSQISRDWMSREEAKKWLGFGDTQFAAITRQYKLVYSIIGRKRLYHIPSLGKTLQDNIKN